MGIEFSLWGLWLERTAGSLGLVLSIFAGVSESDGMLMESSGSGSGRCLSTLELESVDRLLFDISELSLKYKSSFRLS